MSESLLYTQLMERWLKILLIFILSCSVQIKAQEELPFWQTKTKIYKEMSENRKIIVSVQDFKSSHSGEKRILGAGHIQAPFEKVIVEAFKFENLMEVSEYFKKVVHKKGDNQVYIFIQVFGFQSRLLLKYKLNIVNKNFVQLDWIVIWGRLKGMQGNFQIKKIKNSVSEISLWSTVKEIDLPVPDLLINITLEVITEKVAQKMRTYLELKSS